MFSKAIISCLNNLPIVSCGSGSNTENGTPEVELPQSWVGTPVDLLKLRSLCIGNFKHSLILLVGAFETEDHVGDGGLCRSG